MSNDHSALWLLVLIPACFHPSFERPTCGPHGECPDGLTCNAQLVCEAAVDAGVPDAPALCFGSFPRVCFASSAKVPTASMTLTDDIDTTQSPLCDSNNDQPSYCVVAAAGLTIPTGKTIRAFGDRPLVLLSTRSFDLSGMLDVSSTSALAAPHPTGPGVVTITSCAIGTAPADGNSGSFGGSFGGKGGNGQKQDSGNVPSAGPAVSFPSMLRAGCPGGAGNSLLVPTPTSGGKGGGAVNIIASEMRLNGKINASGAGGAGGEGNKIGAGGGGSGGMIVLDAKTIVPGTAYALYANGGGGGQGGAAPGLPNPGAGNDGGESTGPTVFGRGGSNGTTAGGGGGNGAYGIISKDGSDAATGNPANNAGGGAGGGGAGFIHAPGITMNIAPASTNP